MSEATRWFGDGVRISVSGVGGGRFEEIGDSQDYVGVSGRAAVDLVGGGPIFAPHIGLGYARVKSERRQEFTLGLEGEPQGWGAPQGDTFYYSAVTERAEADRLTPRVGLGIGWMPKVQNEALGGQVVFEVGRDLFGNYQIERFPGKRVKVDSNDVGGLSLRAGAEFLVDGYFWGENNPGIGVVIGAYWARSLNPISNEGQDGWEANMGLLFSF